MKRELTSQDPTHREQAELCLRDVYELIHNAGTPWKASVSVEDGAASFTVQLEKPKPEPALEPVKAETVVVEQPKEPEPAPKAVDSIAHD